MTVYKEFNFGGNQRPMGNFGPVIGLIIFLVLAYFVIKGLFTVLAIAAPFLLLAAAIIDYTVIIDYARFIYKMLKENPIFGLVAIVLTIVGYPVVFGYLFAKARMRRRVKKYAEKVENEQNRFDDYTIVKEEEKEEEADFLILPKVEKPVEVKKDPANSEYDNLFK